MYQHRKDRLLQLIDQRYDGLRKRVSDASGWSEARISQLLSATYREGRAFSEKTARKLESDLQLEAMYFDRVEGAANDSERVPQLSSNDIQRLLPGAMPVAIIEEGDPNFYAIPKVKLQLSAGVSGFQTVPEIHDGATLAMPKNWVDRNGYNPSQLIAVTVKGESMEPNLYEGDLVVVNTADVRPVDGHVYAVNYEGEAVIKRLEKDGPVWYLTSDNPAPRYRKKSVRDGHTIIVGRVVRRETDRI